MIGLLPRIVTAFRVQYHSLYRLSTMAAPEGIRSVKEVDIDPDGVFKYILIRVYAGKNKTGESRVIVRGYKHCPYHADIYEEVCEKELNASNFSSQCLGGGRIQHDAADKKLRVYGYSQGFGKADHVVAVEILKKFYPDYKITWSDEGY